MNKAAAVPADRSTADRRVPTITACTSASSRPVRLDAIRNGGPTSCNIERGFEEAITCHMATRSFLEGRKVEWDPVRRRIV